jgi:hypothetical protein
MKEAIGQVLAVGLGVAFSPIPIVAVVLMLATPRARANGPAFLLGWIAGLAIVGAIVLLASLRAWLRETGDEIARLPRQQHPTSAVLPAVPLRRSEHDS